MLFGKRIPATIIRDGTQELPSPSGKYNDFAVVSTFGTTLHSLSPEANITKPFGADPNTLRVVLATWPVGLVDDQPILPLDVLTFNGNSYSVVGTKLNPPHQMEIYVRVGLASTSDEGT